MPVVRLDRATEGRDGTFSLTGRTDERSSNLRLNVTGYGARAMCERSVDSPWRRHVLSRPHGRRFGQCTSRLLLAQFVSLAAKIDGTLARDTAPPPRA
jgi:hypothetical protein